jgi:hypothetical protein
MLRKYFLDLGRSILNGWVIGKGRGDNLSKLAQHRHLEREFKEQVPDGIQCLK